MPPSHELLTDDYVAELLAKEAKDCSLRYSAMGLDAYKSAKRPANQPKPNTRFLNNVIRDTTTHNRALLAKESAESQARLRGLEVAEKDKRNAEEQRSRRDKPGPGDTRKRMLGDIAAILGSSSKTRRPRVSEKPDGSASDRRESTSKSHSERGRRRRHEDSDHGHPNSRKDLFSDANDSRRPPRRKRRDSYSDRSRSPEERKRHSHKRRERSPDRKHDLFDDRPPSGRRGRLGPRSPSPQDPGDDESDPLDDLIGPAPPPPPPSAAAQSSSSSSSVRRRGRGVNSATSGIDSRFAADYDPTADVAPESSSLLDGHGDGNGHGDGDDWDGAVEAFRDRQRWRQQGADRLRAAGFTEEQVGKWERGDRKDESDVRWNKQGGVREWDRGKKLDLDGSVSLKPDFGRLKDT
ncbi:hypothetical protein GGR56DRAFT_643031 [Xylariaceae sp. FL0804]|nr:hypothetical protein GGR56DRAFT_643031 [Xylariaceae sp. FL0804]